MARTTRKSADGVLARDGRQTRSIRRPVKVERRQSTRQAVVAVALIEAV